MGTVVVLAVLAVIVYFAARSVIRDKKAGKCSGGCAGCSGCSGGSCQTQHTSVRNTTKKKRS